MSDATSLRWTGGALEAVAACPACGGGRREGPPFVARDHLGSDGPERWQLWRCAECASLYLDPRPDPASLPAAYSSYYTHAAPAQAGGGLAWAAFNDYLCWRFDWAREPRLPGARWVCRLLPPLALKLDYFGRHLFAREFPARGTLLDVGCGNGEFLGLAQAMGWRAQGLDFDPGAVAVCRAQGFDVREGGLEALDGMPAGSFDAITLSHCIEHLPAPGQALARAARLLRPGGAIWIATPNPQGPGMRLYGRAWRGLEPSRHLCVPSAAQLSRLLEGAGFERIERMRRGGHGKTIVRESARVARLQAREDGGSAWRAALAPALRLYASLAATVSRGGGEETVMRARRKP
jgi:SAM-dependent methyltransferase